MGYISKVAIGTTEYPVGSSLYGTCDTAAATAAKVVTMANFDSLVTGVTIHVKFTNSNTVANPTLNVNSTGAKSIKRYGTTAPSTSVASSWNAGAILSLTYDGTYWMMNDWINSDSNSYPSALSTTAAATAAKTASCDYWPANANSYLHFELRYANTAASAITMNVASTGAKPIYINGLPSSATNYTLPGGSYIAFYDGTNFYFRTDGGMQIGNGSAIKYDSTNKCINFIFD